MVTVEDVQIAQNAEKARLKMPLQRGDSDDLIGYIIYFLGDRPPIAGKLIATEQVFDFPFPTKQEVWFNEVPFIVIEINIPIPKGDFETPERLAAMDAAINRVSQVGLLTDFFATTVLSRTVGAALKFQNRQQRLINARIRTRRPDISGAARLKSLQKEAKLGRQLSKSPAAAKIIAGQKLTKRGAKARGVFKLTRRIKVLGALKVLRVILVPIVILTVVVDIIVIGFRTMQGFQRASFEGAVGGLAGGLVDAVTIGLAPKAADFVEAKTEGIAVRVGKFFTAVSRELGDLGNFEFTISAN